LAMSLEIQLSQLRAATSQNSTCATTVLNMVPSQTLRFSAVAKDYREAGSADLADCIGASVCLAAELGSRIWYEWIDIAATRRTDCHGVEPNAR
jgi:hypothetical protein